MEVSTHYTSFSDTLLCIFTFMLRCSTVSVLVCEVRNHEVSVIDRVHISVVCLLQNLVGIIISELVKYSEVDMVREVGTCCKNVICRVVKQNLLRNVNTFSSRYVVDVLLVHVHESRLGISIASVVIVIADYALLRNIKH